MERTFKVTVLERTTTEIVLETDDYYEDEDFKEMAEELVLNYPSDFGLPETDILSVETEEL